MEQFMRRSLCDRTKREQKRVPVRVQFSVCAHALCEHVHKRCMCVSACLCVNTEEPDGDLKTQATQGPAQQKLIKMKYSMFTIFNDFTSLSKCLRYYR